MFYLVNFTYNLIKYFYNKIKNKSFHMLKQICCDEIYPKKIKQVLGQLSLYML